MSTNSVSSLLAKLDSSLNRKKGAGKKDWAALNEARKKAFYKPQQGKNQILVLTPAGASDPFTIWGYHNNLQEVSYYSVPCDNFNKNEDCVICNVVESLKKENWEGNKHLWMPIEQKTEYYAPIINLESAATIAEGAKWMRISKTIMNQMVESLKNLEEGEFPFFDAENPQRIIINYDKNQSPSAQYTLQFKELKGAVTAQQIADYAGNITPVGEYIISKSQDEVKKLVDEYFTRIAEVVEESIEGNKEAIEEKAAAQVESKLSRLKRG
jgi:hypothetical protein